MKVHIFPLIDTTIKVMVVPAARAHLPPLLLQAGTKEEMQEQLGPALALINRAEMPREAQVPPE